jgi:hypothetical protein
MVAVHSFLGICGSSINGIEGINKEIIFFRLFKSFSIWLWVVGLRCQIMTVVEMSIFTKNLYAKVIHKIKKKRKTATF